MADVPLTDDTPKPPRAPWPDGVGWDTYDDAWQDGWETGYKAAPSVAHQTEEVEAPDPDPQYVAPEFFEQLKSYKSEDAAPFPIGWDEDVADDTETHLQLQATMLELQTARQQNERYRAALQWIADRCPLYPDAFARRALDDKP